MASEFQNIDLEHLLFLIQNSPTWQVLDSQRQQSFLLKAFNTSEEGQLELYGFLSAEAEMLAKFSQSKLDKKADLFKDSLGQIQNLIKKSEGQERILTEQKDRHNEEENLDDLLKQL